MNLQDVLDCVAYVQAYFPNFPDRNKVGFGELIERLIAACKDLASRTRTPARRQWLALAEREFTAARDCWLAGANAEVKVALAAARGFAESAASNRLMDPTFIVDSSGVSVDKDRARRGS